MNRWIVYGGMFLLLLLLSVSAHADVRLEGGEWTIWAGGDTVATLSADRTREEALRQALWLGADTVMMTPIEVVVTAGQFELWKDGSIIQTYETKDAAIQGLKDNQADSITHPPDAVGLKK